MLDDLIHMTSLEFVIAHPVTAAAFFALCGALAMLATRRRRR